MNELALFAGGGGGILAGHLLGWRTVCAVEIEDYPRRVLLQRQADGLLPRFPIWDDITTFDGKPWRGKVDVVSGGFPCQDISVAGRGAGLDGERSGLWGEMARVIREVQPNTHSLRTHQHSLFEDSTECCVILPRWGLMRNGECWDTTTLVGNIEGKESGLLPTPPKNLFNHWSSAKAKYFNGGLRKSGVKVGSTLWWEMTKEHLHLGGLEDRKTIPDPSCGEVVMGWLMGWTELQPLEMDKFQEWQRQHGNY